MVFLRVRTSLPMHGDRMYLFPGILTKLRVNNKWQTRKTRGSYSNNYGQVLKSLMAARIIDRALIYSLSFSEANWLLRSVG
ncbi:hypothetical protein PanWU01x14_162960 [Parasponia andersonii]|uniref:Uncharacterized protein n=1 Tax=Parasponia andersonii TaxID=3476 RepID=A0A2P5CD88_PARAD|nr:hypothetical protein PanWU01x14_162960 [Parasponia andersonii]